MIAGSFIDLPGIKENLSLIKSNVLSSSLTHKISNNLLQDIHCLKYCKQSRNEKMYLLEKNPALHNKN